MAGESASLLLPLVATIIALGVGSQVLASRFRVPSVIFLIAAGILLGPVASVLGSLVLGPGFEGILTQDSFGGALSAIVGLSVAIIVFEGAFHLKVDKLREAPSATLRLVTIGAAVMFVGTAVTVRFALGEAWDLAFLISALLIATGPTVITPILEVVPVRDRVGVALETEGIVNDVTAAILAVVVFETVTLGEAGPPELLAAFAQRLGVGLLVGVVVAALVWYLLRFVDLSPGNAPQNARLLVLAGALVSFSAAQTLATEAGVAAVATAGILLGNADLPYEADIEAFKGDITLLVLSFVFIALAALLEFGDLLALGLGGIAVVLVVALVLRPLAVFLSLSGDRFSRGETLFVSFVGPRGIIPASVATLFAVELRNEAAALREAAAGATGQEAIRLQTEAQLLAGQSDVLVGTVFLVILATVVFEAGFARQIAEYLDVIPMRIIIVGGGTVGRALAERLQDRGENVVLVENDEEVIETARNEGFTVHIGDGTDTEELRSAGADSARIVIAATGDDDVNLLVSQLASSKFDVETVLARANNPDNVDAFEDLGVRTISSTDATAWAMDNAIERPALASWMTSLGQEGDVQEVELHSSELVGRTIREVGPELPGGCLIALVTRDGETRVPDADFTLQEGDHVTILGSREGVREAMEYCRGED